MTYEEGKAWLEARGFVESNGLWESPNVHVLVTFSEDDGLDEAWGASDFDEFVSRYASTPEAALEAFCDEASELADAWSAVAEEARAALVTP